MEKKQTSLMVFISSGVLILLGAILLFAPQIKLYHLSYIVCGLIVAGGVFSIVRYFMVNSFQEESNYGFSIGVLMEVIGITGFIKTDAIVKFFPVAMSMFVVLFGVIVLQDALDLKRLESVLWMVDLALAAMMLVGAMVVLINPFSDDAKRELLSNWLILGTGVMVLISKVALKFIIKGYERKENHKEEKPLIETPVEVDEEIENEQITTTESTEEL